jgi:intein/homing endonuclease
MATQTLRKLNQEVSTLRKDMEDVKRMLFAASYDSEGEYKPAFIKKALKRLSSRGSAYYFTTKEEFLRHVRSSE